MMNNMQQPAQPGAQPPAQAPAQPAAQAAQSAAPADPQQEAQYKRMVQEHIYGSETAVGSEEQGKKTFESLLTMLKAGKGNIHKTIGQAANAIVNKVEEKTGQINEGSLQKVGLVAVVELLELAQKAGAIENVEQNDVVKAAGEAFGQWMKAHPDRIDEEALKNTVQSPQGQQALQQLGMGQQQQAAPAQPAPAAPAAAPQGLIE